MNILIITQYFWPENFRINELADELQSLGNNITVLTGYPNYPEGEFYKDFLKNKKKYSEYKEIKLVRVPIIARGKSKIRLALNYFSFVISATLVGIFKFRKGNFDAIFVFQTSPVFVGIPSSIISIFKKCPQIIWILDLWPDTLEALGLIKKRWQLNIIRKIVKFIYFRCKVILVQSKSFIKEIKKYGHKDIIYFPAWTESEFINSPKKLAKEIKLKKDIFTIIFAGNIGEAQDFPSILNTAEYLINNKFNSFRIILIGDGRKKEWVEKQIYIRNLENNFEILKKYPLGRMPSFFRHADALLVSLKNEAVFNMTIPGKIQTYLASGVPILGMLNGEGAKIINQSKSGFTCPAEDYKGLAKIIIRMSKLTNKKRQELGFNGIQFSKKEFDKSFLLTKLQKLLDDL